MTSLKDKAFAKLCDNYCLKKKCGDKSSAMTFAQNEVKRVRNGTSYRVNAAADIESGGMHGMQFTVPTVTTAKLRKAFGKEHYDAGDETRESGYGKEWSFSSPDGDTFRVYARNDGRRPVYRIGAAKKETAAKFKRWLMKELRR